MKNSRRNHHKNNSDADQGVLCTHPYHNHSISSNLKGSMKDNKKDNKNISKKENKDEKSTVEFSRKENNHKERNIERVVKTIDYQWKW